MPFPALAVIEVCLIFRNAESPFLASQGRRNPTKFQKDTLPAVFPPA